MPLDFRGHGPARGSRLSDGRQPSERQLALFTSAYARVVGVCVEVVQLVYKAAGGGAVYQKGPLDRCLRDVLTTARLRRLLQKAWSEEGKPK